MTVQLQALKILEVSAVDAPATELDGYMVLKAKDYAQLPTFPANEIIAKAAKPMTDDALYDFVIERLEKANSGQHRDGSTGRFLAGIVDRQPELPSLPAAAGELSREGERVTRGFFRPARNPYRRIF